MHNIVVTGTGVISAAGEDAASVLDGMASGTHFFNREFPGKRSLHPSFPWPEASLRQPDVAWPTGASWADIKKYANASSHQAVAVARIAIETSGVADEASGARCGAIMASGSRTDELAPLMSRLGAMARTDPRPLAKLLYDEVPDYSYLRGIPCQIGQFVCLATGFRGSNVAAYGEAGASGLGGLALAVRMIRSGELDRVIVVAVGAPITPAMLVGYDRDDALGTQSIPGRGPFDVERAGTLLGHGAAAVVIETEETALRRGAPQLARLLSCEAINATSQKQALELATQMVMEEASVRPHLWWAHGAGSKSMDQMECQTVGPMVKGALTTSSKGTIGNASEAAGLIDIVLAVQALQRGSVPPVGLLRTPDPELGPVQFVKDTSRSLPAGRRAALVTALDQRVESAAAAMIVVEGGTA